MNCSQCGSPIVEGSLFCQKCGAPIQEQTSAPAPQPIPPQQPGFQQPPYQPYAQQPYSAQPYPGTPQPKKKKTGLVIGLIAGAVVLIGAALALYFFVFSGTSVAGQWYCEERGQVLVFSGEDTVTGYSLTGTVEAKFDFDKSKGKGAVNANGTELPFTIEKKELVLTDEQNDDESAFVKVDSKSDPKELVLSALQGLWSSEETGEVLEFDNGKINVYSGNGDFNGTYDYDIEKGQGTFTANGADFEFSADYNALSVTDIGNYVKTDKNLDIKAFVAEHAMPIAGMWYDTSGTYGTLEIYTDGTAQLIMFDKPVPATYTFDIATGTGTFSTEVTGQTSTMTYKDGTIEIDGIIYSKEAVEQMSADDLPTVIGLWYETTGTLGTLEFYDDGSVMVIGYGLDISGTYTYDALKCTGQIFLVYNGETETSDFSCDGSTLKVNDVEYTHEYVEPVVNITGIWYDLGGSSSTLNFYDASSVNMVDPNGVELNGSYIFDGATGLGSMNVSDGASSVTYDISLNQGTLSVNGLQYALDNVDDGL